MPPVSPRLVLDPDPIAGRPPVTVHLARYDPDTGETLAVKRIDCSADVAAGQRAVDDFQATIRHLRLTGPHPYVVLPGQVLFRNRFAFITMPYYQEGTLAACLRSRAHRDPPGIDLPELIGYMTCVAAGLDYLHDAGEVHGDVKPSNLFRYSTRYAAVADFGFDWPPPAPDAPSPLANLGCCTLEYAPPELLNRAYRRRRPRRTAAGDLYSLAVTYAHLRLGSHPFVQPGDSPLDIVLRMGAEQADWGGIVGDELDVLRRGTRADPANRFTGTCTAFVQELARATRTAPATTAPPPTGPQAPDPFAQIDIGGARSPASDRPTRRAAAVAASAATAAAMVAVGGYLVWGRGPGAGRAPNPTPIARGADAPAPVVARAGTTASPASRPPVPADGPAEPRDVTRPDGPGADGDRSAATDPAEAAPAPRPGPLAPPPDTALPDGGVRFAGAAWVPRSGPQADPPITWADDATAVWVDKSSLHLKIGKRSTGWACAEVIGRTAAGYAGYGDYRFELALGGGQAFDGLDDQAVFTFGLGRYAGDQQQAVAFELSAWGIAGNANTGQLIVGRYAGEESPNLTRFAARTPRRLAVEVRWLPGKVTGRCWDAGRPGGRRVSLCETSFAPPNVTVPAPDGEHTRVRLGLWLAKGLPPQKKKEQEVVVSAFTYTPADTAAK